MVFKEWLEIFANFFGLQLSRFITNSKKKGNLLYFMSASLKICGASSSFLATLDQCKKRKPQLEIKVQQEMKRCLTFGITN